MDMKMMKAAELEQAIEDADHEHWRYIELSEDRREARDEDEALHCDTSEYDREIAVFDDKADKALDRMTALVGERMRRLGLSNHARLAEAALRGEVPA